MSGSSPARELSRSQKVDAAYKNEYLTRQRVEALEDRVLTLEKAQIEHLKIWWGQRTLKGRLRWLFTGR